MREEPCTWYELAVPPRRQLNVHQEAGDRPNSMLARLLEMLASRGEFEDQEEMEEEDINIMQQAIAEIEDSGELDMDQADSNVEQEHMEMQNSNDEISDEEIQSDSAS